VILRCCFFVQATASSASIKEYVAEVVEVPWGLT
jgi:hypothetical protein